MAKRKRGRPKLAQRRTALIQLRLTEDDKTVIEQRAREVGAKSVSAYLRAKGLAS